MRGTIALTTTTSADTTQVTFERSPAGAGTWTTIAVDNTPPFAASLDTTLLTDGLYDLHAIASDGAHLVTSNVVTTRIDNTAPTGSVTAPTAGATIGGPSVTLGANPTDAGSGVATVAVPRRRHAGRHRRGRAVAARLGSVVDAERSAHDRRGRDRRRGQLDHDGRRAGHRRLDSAERDAHRSRRAALRQRHAAGGIARLRTPSASTSRSARPARASGRPSRPTRPRRTRPHLRHDLGFRRSLRLPRDRATTASATCRRRASSPHGASTTRRRRSSPRRRPTDRRSASASSISVTASEALSAVTGADARRRRDRRTDDLRRDRARSPPARSPTARTRFAGTLVDLAGKTLGLHDPLHDRQRHAAGRLAVRRDERVPGRDRRRSTRPTGAPSVTTDGAHSSASRPPRPADRPESPAAVDDGFATGSLVYDVTSLLVADRHPGALASRRRSRSSSSNPTRCEPRAGDVRERSLAPDPPRADAGQPPTRLERRLLRRPGRRSTS